ncbi:MAG: hypothetical protein HYU32_03380 [candidate division NC10 bacterium]|nr:hypothetical protein [candidate division NC10 bacterium]
MDIRGWIMRRIWGGGRSVRYVFIHPTCGHDDVEAGYLRGVAFDEATVRLRWPGEEAPPGG